MATPVYADWQAIKLRVSSGLHVAVADLPAMWDDLIAESNRDAAAELKRLFVLKGYPVSQFEQWDDLRVYNEMLGAFFAFVRGVGLASYDLKAVEYLDPRKAIQEAAALIIDGAAVAPDASAVGGVSHGLMDSAQLLNGTWQERHCARGAKWFR